MDGGVVGSPGTARPSVVAAGEEAVAATHNRNADLGRVLGLRGIRKCGRVYRASIKAKFDSFIISLNFVQGFSYVQIRHRWWTVMLCGNMASITIHRLRS